MHRVDVILDIEPEYLTETAEREPHKKIKNRNNKTIKITNELFELALREGLIEKTSEGYVFVGKLEDVVALKKKKD